MVTHIRKPTVITAAGNKPKLIKEFVGRVNSKSEALSIARMKSPGGWVEPGQTPEFDEYTVVLAGVLQVAQPRTESPRFGQGSDRRSQRRVGAVQHARSRRCRVPRGLSAGVLPRSRPPRFVSVTFS